MSKSRTTTETRGRKRTLPGLEHLSPQDYKRAYQRRLYQLRKAEKATVK